MTERKLLVGPEDAEGTFTKAFSKAARLPTPEDRQRAVEQGVRDLVSELYRPKYQGPTQRDTRMPVGNGHGWSNEVPIGPPEGISLIDRICDAHLPPPKPRVEIIELKGVPAEVVRQKLSQAVAAGKITRAVMEEQLALLGIGP